MDTSHLSSDVPSSSDAAAGHTAQLATASPSVAVTPTPVAAPEAAVSRAGPARATGAAAEGVDREPGEAAAAARTLPTAAAGGTETRIAMLSPQEDGALLGLSGQAGDGERDSSAFSLRVPQQQLLLFADDAVASASAAVYASDAAPLDAAMTASPANAAGSRSDTNTADTPSLRAPGAAAPQSLLDDASYSSVSSAAVAAAQLWTPLGAAASSSRLSSAPVAACSYDELDALSAACQSAAAAGYTAASPSHPAAAAAAARNDRRGSPSTLFPSAAAGGMPRERCAASCVRGACGAPAATAAAAGRRGGRTGAVAAHAAAAAAANSPTNLWLTLQSGRRGWTYPPPFVSQFCPSLTEEPAQQRYAVATRASCQQATPSRTAAARPPPQTAAAAAAASPSEQQGAAAEAAASCWTQAGTKTTADETRGVACEEGAAGRMALVQSTAALAASGAVAVRVAAGTAVAAAAHTAFERAAETSFAPPTRDKALSLGSDFRRSEAAPATANRGVLAAPTAAALGRSSAFPGVFGGAPEAGEAAATATEKMDRSKGLSTDANGRSDAWESGGSSSPRVAAGEAAARDTGMLGLRQKSGGEDTEGLPGKRLRGAENVEALDEAREEPGGSKWDGNSNGRAVCNKEEGAGETGSGRLCAVSSSEDRNRSSWGSSVKPRGPVSSSRTGGSSSSRSGENSSSSSWNWSRLHGSTRCSTGGDRSRNSFVEAAAQQSWKGRRAATERQLEQEQLLLVKYQQEEEAARLYRMQQRQSVGWLYDTKQQQHFLYPAFEKEDWWRCSKSYELQAQAVWDVNARASSSTTVPDSSSSSLFNSVSSSSLFSLLSSSIKEERATSVAPRFGTTVAAADDAPAAVDNFYGVTPSQQHQQQPGGVGTAGLLDSRRKTSVVLPPSSTTGASALSSVSPSSDSSSALWDVLRPLTPGTTAAAARGNPAAASGAGVFSGCPIAAPAGDAPVAVPSVEFAAALLNRLPQREAGAAAATSADRAVPARAAALLGAARQRPAATEGAAMAGGGCVGVAGVESGSGTCSRKVRLYLDGLGPRGVNGGHAGGGWTRAGGGGGVFTGGVARYFSQKLRCCWDRAKQQQFLLRPVPLATTAARTEEDDEDPLHEDEERRPPFGCSFRGRGHFGCVNAISFSTDGELLASGSDDTRVLLWRATGAKKVPVHQIQTRHSANIFCVQFDTSDQYLLTSGNDGRVIRTCIQHPHDVAVRNDLDETMLLRGGAAADLPMRLRLLRLRELGGASYQASFLFSGHTQAIAAMEGGTLETFDFRERHGLGQVVERTLASVLSVAVHPLDDFLFAFCCCPKAALCDIRKNKAVCILKEPIRYCTSWPPPPVASGTRGCQQSASSAAEPQQQQHIRKAGGGAGAAQQPPYTLAGRPSRQRGTRPTGTAALATRAARRATAAATGPPPGRQAGGERTVAAAAAARGGRSGEDGAAGASGAAAIERFLRRRQRTARATQRRRTDTPLAILDAPAPADDITSIRSVAAATAEGGARSQPHRWRFAVHTPLTLDAASAARAEENQERGQQQQQRMGQQARQQPVEQQLQPQDEQQQQLSQQQQQQSEEQQAGRLAKRHEADKLQQQRRPEEQQHQQPGEQSHSERQEPLQDSKERPLQVEGHREETSDGQQQRSVGTKQVLVGAPAGAAAAANDLRSSTDISGLAEPAAPPSGAAPTPAFAAAAAPAEAAASTEAAATRSGAADAGTQFSRDEAAMSTPQAVAAADVVMEEAQESKGVSRCKRPRQFEEKEQQEERRAPQEREQLLPFQVQQHQLGESKEHEQLQQQQQQHEVEELLHILAKQRERGAEEEDVQASRGAPWQVEEPAASARRCRRRLSYSGSGDGSADAGEELWGEQSFASPSSLRAELLADLASAALPAAEDKDQKDDAFLGSKSESSSSNSSGGSGSSFRAGSSTGRSGRGSICEGGKSSSASKCESSRGSSTNTGSRKGRSADFTTGGSTGRAGVNEGSLEARESSSSGREGSREHGGVHGGSSSSSAEACLSSHSNSSSGAPLHIISSSSSGYPASPGSDETSDSSSAWTRRDETTVEQEPEETLTTVLQRVLRRNQRGARQAAAAARLAARSGAGGTAAAGGVVSAAPSETGSTRSRDATHAQAAAAGPRSPDGACETVAAEAATETATADAGAGGYVSEPEEFVTASGTDFFTTEDRAASSPISTSADTGADDSAAHVASAAGDAPASATSDAAAPGAAAAASREEPAADESRSAAGEDGGGGAAARDPGTPLSSVGEGVQRRTAGAEETAAGGRGEENEGGSQTNAAAGVAPAAIRGLRRTSEGGRSRGSSSNSSRRRRRATRSIAQLQLQLRLQALRTRVQREVTASTGASRRRREQADSEENAVDGELAALRKQKEESTPLRGADRVVFSWSGRLMLIIRRRRYPLVYLTGHPLPIFELRSEGWRNFMTLKAGCFLFDDRHIAIGSEDKRVHVWRLPDVIDVEDYVKQRYTQVLQSVFCLRGHASIVNCCASTPPVTRTCSCAPPLLASCGIERMIRFWLLQRPGEGDKDDCLFYPPDNVYVKDESLEDEIVILRFNSAARRLAAENERRLARRRDSGGIVESSSEEDEADSDMEEEDSEENSESEEEAGGEQPETSDESSEDGGGGGGGSGDEGNGHRAEDRVVHTEEINVKRTEGRDANEGDACSVVVDVSECVEGERSECAEDGGSRRQRNSSSSSSRVPVEATESRLRFVVGDGDTSGRGAVDSRSGDKSQLGGGEQERHGAEGHEGEERSFAERDSVRRGEYERGSTEERDVSATEGETAADQRKLLGKKDCACRVGVPSGGAGPSQVPAGEENEQQDHSQGTTKEKQEIDEQVQVHTKEEVEAQTELQRRQRRTRTGWGNVSETGTEESSAERFTSQSQRRSCETVRSLAQEGIQERAEDGAEHRDDQTSRQVQFHNGASGRSPSRRFSPDRTNSTSASSSRDNSATSSSRCNSISRSSTSRGASDSCSNSNSNDSSNSSGTSLSRSTGASGSRFVRTTAVPCAMASSDCVDACAGGNIPADGGHSSRGERPEGHGDSRAASIVCDRAGSICEDGGGLVAEGTDKRVVSAIAAAGVKQQTRAQHLAEDGKESIPDSAGKKAALTVTEADRTHKALIHRDEADAAAAGGSRRPETSCTEVAATPSAAQVQTDMRHETEACSEKEVADEATPAGAGSRRTTAAMHRRGDTSQIHGGRDVEEEDEEGVGAPATGAGLFATGSGPEDADEEEGIDGGAYTFIRYTVPRREMF